MKTWKEPPEETPGDAQPHPHEPFELISADDIDDGFEDPMDFVEGLLTEGGASVIYGPSNCGKSFWVVDLAAHVASGTDWRCGDHAVDQGAVIYLALEGSTGAKNRIKALKKHGKLPPQAPFYLCFDQVCLLEPGHTGRLVETIMQAAKTAAMPVKLVILDTLSRAMAGGDENSGQDMTEAVRAMDAIREATGAHVCLIHHCGKDEARGARGHSSLRAAVDTEIEVSRPEGETVTTVRVTKQRDLSIGDPMPFSLEVVELGVDRRGNPITSCVVRHEDEMMAAKPRKAGRKPICTPDDLLRFLPAPGMKEWQQRVGEELGLGKSQFYEHVRQLEQHGKIKREGKGVRLA